MSIIRVGLAETDKFAEGWERIFGKEEPASAKAKKPAKKAKASAKKKPAKAAAPKKKKKK